MRQTNQPTTQRSTYPPTNRRAYKDTQENDTSNKVSETLQFFLLSMNVCLRWQAASLGKVQSSIVICRSITLPKMIHFKPITPVVLCALCLSADLLDLFELYKYSCQNHKIFSSSSCYFALQLYPTKTCKYDTYDSIHLQTFLDLICISVGLGRDTDVQEVIFNTVYQHMVKPTGACW